MKNMKHITKLFTTTLGAACLAGSAFAEKTVAVYDLEGAIAESGVKEANLLSLGNTSRQLTHYDLVESLNAALSDDDLKAVVLDVDGASMDVAQIQEIRRLLLQLRKQGKDIWLYTEALSIQTALLGSAANHMTLLPEGNVMLTGLYGENMYFKKLLDKVGVKVEVIHIGDFKSAGENFYRTGPSEYAQKQTDALMDSMYGQIVEQIAKGRGLTTNQVKAVMDKGLVTPEEALKAKLVDHLEYRTDFIKKVRKHYGEDTEFDTGYNLPDLNGPEINGIMDLMKMAFKKKERSEIDSDYVAVVTLDGGIDDASIAPVRAEILRAQRDEFCKALVLRVNSPGGSALSSDVLWEATEEFKATGRPFVVSMGGVAASGGYYVSAGADRIFAEEGTITGSIGVVGMKFVLGDAMDKLGITTHGTKRGKHADIMNTSRSYTEEEAKLIRNSMLDVYGTFKKRIMDGRGKKIKGDLEKLAGGRVYSGKDALAIGLVDELGGLNEAINHAGKLAKLDSYDTYLFPEPSSGLEGMLSGGDSGDDYEFIKMNAKKPSTVLRTEILNNSALRLLGPQKQQQINRFIKQVEAFQNQRVLMIAPSINIHTK